jgi:hypothetical protein
MIIAIIGSRSREVSFEEIVRCLPCPLDQVEGIVSGGAKGVDTCAERFAAAKGIPFQKHLPDYEFYGKTAPLVRNEAIVSGVHHVLAFPSAKGSGTQHAIGAARRFRVPVSIFMIGRQQLSLF